jgi:beta-glucosidase-like glycosyl hydrolase
MTRPLELPLLVPAIRLDKDVPKEIARALKRARAPWLAGFLVFGGHAEQVRALTDDLRARAGRPIFVASDMERGAGQQVEGLAHLPDLGVYGLAATPHEVEALGEATAREALSVGVDVLFAPVLDVRSEPDNPIVGNRSFGWDPLRVGLLGAAYCRGALRGGAAPVGKHAPGHGATTGDSHDSIPVVEESRARIVERDLLPFAIALESGGCPALMTAHVAYPALDPSRAIASFSAPILERVRALAPDPDLLCLFCDALCMSGALGVGSETLGARAALLAGCDALLYPEEPERVAAELFDVSQRAPLQAAAERALMRVRALLGRITLARAESRGQEPVLPEAPLDVARRALALAGGGALRPERRWVLVLDDDGVGYRGQVLSEAGRQAGVAVTVVRVADDARPLDALLGPGGLTVVVMASVRAWKGASGVSRPLKARLAELEARANAQDCPLQVLWLAPRAAGQGLLLPGGGPDVERALAEILFPPAGP